MRIYLIPITLILLHAETECIQVPGDRIRAADLAKRIEAFQQVDGDVEVGFAPLPGGRRVYTALELQRIAARNGVSASIPSDICVQMQTRLLELQDVKKAIEQELETRGVQNATVEVLDFSRYPVPTGQLQFNKAGLSPPAQQSSVLQSVLWRGRVTYGGSRSLAVWARVRMSVEAEVSIAARDLAPSVTMSNDDVVVEKRRLFPFGGVRFAEPNTAAGKRTKRSLRKGDVITATVLENPKEVERGDKVDVAVSSGAAQLRLDAIAESAGQIGERVLVRNPISGKRFQATVESKGHVTVAALSEEKN